MSKDAFYLGRESYSGELFWIPDSHRAVHSYVVGASGAGKSELLLDWFMQDFVAGRGCCLIDPKGDLFQDVLAALATIPAKEWPAVARHVVIIDPSDEEWVVGFNPLQVLSNAPVTRQRHEVISAFRKVWRIDETRTPRMELVLRRALQVLMANGLTLVQMQRLLVDTAYRESLVNRCTEEDVRTFWLKEFPKSETAQQQWVSSLLTRLETFLDDTNLQLMLGQRSSSFDFRRAMDEQKVVLINLSKGRLGQETSHLLGGFLLAKLQLAGESRQDVWPPEARLPFYVYVDEFQNYATDSFQEMLAEARGYGVRLVMAHQNVSQLDESLRASILANARIRLAFRLSYDDSATLARELFFVTGQRVKETRWQSARIGKLAIPYPEPVYFSTGEEMRQNVEELHHLPDRVFWLNIAGRGVLTQLVTNPVPRLWSPEVGEAIRDFKALSAELGGYAVPRTLATPKVLALPAPAAEPVAKRLYEYQGVQ